MHKIWNVGIYQADVKEVEAVAESEHQLPFPSLDEWE
jgi:hypothetical protein